MSEWVEILWGFTKKNQERVPADGVCCPNFQGRFCPRSCLVYLMHVMSKYVISPCVILYARWLQNYLEDGAVFIVIGYILRHMLQTKIQQSAVFLLTKIVPLLTYRCTLGLMYLHRGPFIYYVRTCRGEGGVRKCQFLLFSVLKTCLLRGEGGPKMCLRNIWMFPKWKTMKSGLNRPF